MNGTCVQDQIGFIKFSILPEFVPLLMDKDLLHKIFVSLRGIKQELYAKSFQVNDIHENLPPHVEDAVVNLKRDAKDLSRDLQRLEVRGKLGSKPLFYWSRLRQTANVSLYDLATFLPLLVLFTVLYNYTKSVDSRQFTAIRQKRFELFLFAHFLI